VDSIVVLLQQSIEHVSN